MCAIIGALVRTYTEEGRVRINKILDHIYTKSHERGRDGRGYMIMSSAQPPMVYHDTTRLDGSIYSPAFKRPCQSGAVIGNLRAEPTTEFVEHKQLLDQQPYSAGQWTIVHNGTIANDHELRTGQHKTSIDSAAIVEQLAEAQQYGDGRSRWRVFTDVIKLLKGSYAILAVHSSDPGTIYAACNYRPIWYAVTDYGVFFASARTYFPDHMVPQMLKPYTAAKFGGAHVADMETEPLYRGWGKNDRTALVVCSGGLDSVVAATYAKVELGMNLHLIHFQYGSRAEGPEVDAVKQVAEHLGAELTLFPLPVYRKEDSPLLDSDATVAGGEAGAEFAHEWVPARNLVMLSVATAFAEARGMEIIVLGNNLEEAGAYPDNEPEFISRFNDLLPFAVGDGKRMRVVMPVGNYMKHEIVALGARLGAPMHLTWSCYRAGEKHCGTCGPCYMRRKAFEINKLKEVIEYVPVN